MKTVKEWFESIKDEDVRQRALANMINPDFYAYSLSRAFFWGISYGNTDEGDDYWNEQDQKALNNEL